ncbi:UDP-glucose 6-dehydrogenase [Candidatus Gottesmanbacteria bacterium RBG_13_37_7]|uniref:UDP-glucose 6-dehydrogenase n=1 Tax=Candidatus Gottesmanbacteria bacterium RBG_13_37_7 TaxID=1798369 RepID=A0A1F5YJZ1_9BACT|nr:MAG: UDP-glucose 6-dehydrogenase [Candidatus Gottesmanbacteria bacterium RBG_13_37_7]
MTIAFIGHGYVGLVTASVFADLGNTVWVVGRTPEKIDKLKKGITPFYEPGLTEMVKRNIEADRLKFTLQYQEALSYSQIVFICVGTPSKPNGEADLSSVFDAATKIGKNLKKYTVVVTKSTVPVGTNRIVAEIINKVKPQKITFDIASCPEFLKEGSAISDTLYPDRIVIGTDAKKAKDLLLDLHKPINGERVVTGIETAEMIKYASNALLSTKISFANAMSFICDAVGADVELVLKGVGLDNRLGRSFLYPGVGFGGSCFPKDVKALIAIAAKNHYNFSLLKAVNEINHEAKKRFVHKIISVFPDLKGKIFAVWGLSFKPNTDDMREAPSIEIINQLLARGAKIKAFDPIAMEKASAIFTGVEYCQSPKEAAIGADAILILTEWNEFKQIDLKEIINVMREKNIFDGRNIYQPEKVKKLGFNYKGIGRF